MTRVREPYYSSTCYAISRGRKSADFELAYSGRVRGRESGLYTHIGYLTNTLDGYIIPAMPNPGLSVASVERKVLKALDGVAKADVSLDQRNAVVDYDPGKLGVVQLKRAIEEAGYEVAP